MDTNVVLLSLKLLLPIFNEFADKADLDLKRPLTEERITKSKIGRSYNSGTLVIFDNRHQLNWNCASNYWGRIDTYTDQEFASNYFWDSGDKQRLEAWTKQKSRIDENEALQIATRVLHRLGYSESRQQLKPPIVRQYRFGKDKKGNVRLLPFYGVMWYPKNPKEWESHAFKIEVSGLTKKITQFSQLWVENTYMDLRPLIQKLPKPLLIATNQTGVVEPSSNLRPKR